MVNWMNYISERFAKIRGRMAKKNTLTIHLVHGGAHSFEMTSKEIEKTIFALENVDMQWILIKDMRLRPSAIVAIAVE